MLHDNGYTRRQLRLSGKFSDMSESGSKGSMLDTIEFHNHAPLKAWELEYKSLEELKKLRPIKFEEKEWLKQLIESCT